MLFYCAALPLSRQTPDDAAGIIRQHRRQIGSPWRKLSPGRQALLVPAYLRKGETSAELAAGFGVGTATAWRYVTGTVALLAARSPKPRQALRDASKAGHAYLVIDGTVIPIDRGRGRPAVLFRQAPPARDEPAGHRQPRRRHRVGVRPAARGRA
jgi:DDE superfamily endonuclease